MLWLGLGILVLTWIGITFQRRDNAPPAKQPTAAESVADAHSTLVYGAIDACEKWTNHYAKLGVAKIVDEYELTQAVRKDHVAVGIEWRAEGSGLLMYSSCEYEHSGSGSWLVKASSRPM